MRGVRVTRQKAASSRCGLGVARHPLGSTGWVWGVQAGSGLFYRRSQEGYLDQEAGFWGQGILNLGFAGRLQSSLEPPETV